VIHLTATKTLDHRNMPHVLSKLRDVQQKKLDVHHSKTRVLARIYLACLLQVLNVRDRSACRWFRDVQQAAVSVESQAHSCDTFCKTSWPGRRDWRCRSL